VLCHQLDGALSSAALAVVDVLRDFANRET
jgi:hypothetical protein